MELLSQIKTVEDRNRLYSEIELVQDALYKEGELEKVLSSQVSGALAEAIDPIKPRDDIRNTLLNLKTALDQLGVVRLTIAFEPSESTIDKAALFVRQSLSEKAIVEFLVEPKILGGIIFEYRGTYIDYTLKTKLDEVFKNKKEKLFQN